MVPSQLNSRLGLTLIQNPGLTLIQGPTHPVQGDWQIQRGRGVARTRQTRLCRAPMKWIGRWKKHDKPTRNMVNFTSRSWISPEQNDVFSTLGNCEYGVILVIWLSFGAVVPPKQLS